MPADPCNDIVAELLAEEYAECRLWSVESCAVVQVAEIMSATGSHPELTCLAVAKIFLRICGCTDKDSGKQVQNFTIHSLGLISVLVVEAKTPQLLINCVQNKEIVSD